MDEDTREVDDMFEMAEEAEEEKDEIDQDFILGLNEGEAILVDADPEAPVEAEEEPPALNEMGLPQGFMPPGLSDEMKETLMKAREMLAAKTQQSKIEVGTKNLLDEYENEEEAVEIDQIEQEDFDDMLAEFIDEHKGNIGKDLYEKYGQDKPIIKDTKLADEKEAQGIIATEEELQKNA